MKIDFDQEANALMIQFRKGKAKETKELDEDTIIDLDDRGILAIELLDVVPKISLESLSNFDIHIPIEKMNEDIKKACEKPLTPLRNTLKPLKKLD